MLTQRKITNKQKLLIDTIVATGCSITKASQIAGYSDGDSGRVTASKIDKSMHLVSGGINVSIDLS